MKRIILLSILTMPNVLVGQQSESYAIRTVVGNGARQVSPGKDVDVIPALEADVRANSLAIDSRGRLFFTDRDVVRMYDPVTATVSRIAGQFGVSRPESRFGGDGANALQSNLFVPLGLAFDKERRLLVADAGNNRIRRITNPGGIAAVIETIAGNGTAINAGDGGPVANATFRAPNRLSFAADGTLFVSSLFDFRLRAIGPTGVLGPGWGPEVRTCGLASLFCYANDLASEPGGKMLVADLSNRIYAVNPQGRFEHIAGTGGFAPGTFSGDGAPATTAGFGDIQGLATDPQKNTFVADYSNHRIRVIAPDGIIRTVAGTGKGGVGGSFGGDDGPASEADLSGPTRIAVSVDGKVYFIDSGNARIRVLVPCKFELKLESSAFDSLGGTGELSLTANERGCGWTAKSDAIWLTLVKASGVGSEKLSIRVTPNSSDGVRSGTIRVGGQSITITQTASGVLFPRITSAAQGASFEAGIAPGGWAVLTGTSLAATTRTWNDPDFVANRLPATLDGVSVKVGNRDATVYFISPTQINFLVPSGLAAGPSTIEVSTRNGKGTFTTVIKSVAPAFFLVSAPRDGLALAAAVHADGGLVGEIGAVPGAAARPAAPGGAITVYGTGFGPTNPPIPDGVAGVAPAALANEVTVFIGGQKAQVDYAGVVGPGLVQINLRVPEFLPKGRHSIVAAINAVESPQSAAIAIDEPQ